jgi:hypothetical protein
VLDLDHVRAEVGEERGRERPGKQRGGVDDLQAGERRTVRHATSGLSR